MSHYVIVIKTAVLQPNVIAPAPTCLGGALASVKFASALWLPGQVLTPVQIARYLISSYPLVVDLALMVQMLMEQDGEPSLQVRWAAWCLL